MRRSPGKNAGSAPLDIAGSEPLVATFRSGLSVTVVPKTELIEIRYRSRSPQLSENIVNALVNAYIERNFKVKYESTMQASDWLQKQLDELRSNVARTQEKLAQFQNNMVLFSGGGNDESKNSTVNKLDELNRQLTLAQTERIVKEAAWRMAESGNPELVWRCGGEVRCIYAARATSRAAESIRPGQRQVRLSLSQGRATQGAIGTGGRRHPSRSE